MKHTMINKFLKITLALSMILGISAPLKVQASLIDFGSVNTQLNGNTAIDSFASFPISIPGLNTTVTCANNNAVTLVYNPTSFPVFLGFADLEGMSLNIANNTGASWSHLKIEFLDLAANSASVFASQLIVNFPNPNVGTSVVSGTTIDASYTTSFSAPNPFNFTVSNSIENFASNQAGNQFRVRITPTGVAQTPVPAAVWLFGTGLLGLFGGGMNKRRLMKN